MSDIETITTRYIKCHSPSLDIVKAKAYSDAMLANGSFDDLNYECNPKYLWKAMSHFDRLTLMALNNDYDKAITGIEFWFSKERFDSNWWWNEIGLQKKSSLLALLIKPFMDKSLSQRFVSIFNVDIKPKWTGANKCWLAQNILIRGLFEENTNLVKKGSEFLESVIFISQQGEEGIQPDFSFAQHGSFLYNYGYGLELLQDCCKWIDIFSGTQFQFQSEKINILCRLLLDGNRYMCYHSTVDFNTIGRNIVRGYNSEKRSIRFLDKVINILRAESSFEKELDKLKDYIHGNSKTPGFIWTKMFPCLNFMTHLRDGYYASTRFGSKFVLGGDISNGKCINGEGLISGFQAYFLTHYLVDGDEYFKIFPLWNWAFLPGVTCPEVELPTEQGAVMKSSFAGGVSDGIYGVCAVDLHESFELDKSVSFGGKKACFYFDNEIIQLGCELYSDSTLNTTLNQCHLKGTVIADGKQIQAGTYKIKANYVHHNKISYCFLQPTESVLSFGHKKGSWKRITTVSTQDPLESSGDIFTLYIPHTKASTYAFAVLPNSSVIDATKYKPPEYVNTNVVQAVYKNGILGAVFYQSGSLKIGGMEITTDAPCFVLISENNIQTAVPKGFSQNVNVQQKNIKRRP